MSQSLNNIFLKFLSLIFVIFIIGLPINSIISFLFLLFSVPVILFSKISIKNTHFYFLFISFLLFIIFKITFPSLKIQEGHNVVVLNDNSYKFYKDNLPNEVFIFFEEKFTLYYENSKCDEKISNCWKNFNPNINLNKSGSTNKIFVDSSDWSINKKKYSRVVSNIEFSNIKNARIGAINNLDYNFFWPKKNDLVRENIPFFVMYEIPFKLIGSSICWEGIIFWENENDNFSKISNKNYKCKEINIKDAGKSIYIVSFGSSANSKRIEKLYGKVFLESSESKINYDNFNFENDINIQLKKDNTVLIKEYFEKIIKLLLFFLILFIFFKFNFYLYLFSIAYLFLFCILIYFVNKDLLIGFVVFTGGNDGLVYMSFGNTIFENIKSFNFYEALRGAENIFYFPSSLRYFWSINKIFFGETIYGYLIVGYFYPLVFYYILKYILGFKWSLVITSIIFLTRLLEGYSMSVFNMIQHINEGDAEPLSILLILFSILIFILIINKKISSNSKFYNILFSLLIFLSVSVRPNFLPTGIFLIFSLIFYNLYFNKNIKNIFFILVGFSPIVLIPLHNFLYGNAYVLLSSGSQHNTFAPIPVYINAFQDMFFLKWNQSSDIYIVLNQINKWIQPKEIHFIISFLVLVFMIIKKNTYIIKSICIAALSQHFVLLVFMPNNRYAYLAWILTMIINFYFIKESYYSLMKRKI